MSSPSQPNPHVTPPTSPPVCPDLTPMSPLSLTPMYHPGAPPTSGAPTFPQEIVFLTFQQAMKCLSGKEYAFAFSSHIGVELEATIVLHTRTNVPAIQSARAEGSSLIRFEMYYTLDAWWSHWCSLKVVRTEDAFVF